MCISNYQWEKIKFWSALHRKTIYILSEEMLQILSSHKEVSKYGT